jgi:phosphatidylserine/phosphatidylglycerophosphate/cardiolipin synthase-like enzyme
MTQTPKGSRGSTAACRQARQQLPGTRSDTARQEIDLAAYVLTDWPVIEALARAANRGVKVRIYLDRTQLAEHTSARPFLELVEAPGVETRTKRQNGTPMHLKSYQIDGRVLRTGAVMAPSDLPARLGGKEFRPLEANPCACVR